MHLRWKFKRGARCKLHRQQLSLGFFFRPLRNICVPQMRTRIYLADQSLVNYCADANAGTGFGGFSSISASEFSKLPDRVISETFRSKYRGIAIAGGEKGCVFCSIRTEMPSGKNEPAQRLSSIKWSQLSIYSSKSVVKEYLECFAALSQ